MADAEIWIAACAHELHRRWRTAGAEQLEEVARDLAARRELRMLSPAAAATSWLAPIELSRGAPGIAAEDLPA